MKITLVKSLVLLGAFLCFGITQAQEVSGTVSDASGPLPGASVLEKGTTNGTQTDFDGNYRLEIPTGTYNLRVSFVGYQTETKFNIELNSGNAQIINILWLTT